MAAWWHAEIYREDGKQLTDDDKNYLDEIRYG